MKSRFAAALAGTIVLTAAALVGCESATVSPEAAAMLLSEKPAETMSVTEVREKVEAGEAGEQVAVEAQIGGAPVPFIPEHAGFFVTAAAASHDHDHDHEGHDHEGHDHADHDHASHDHASHDHASHDHASHDHADHDHADHDHAAEEHDHAHADEHAGHDHGEEGHVHSHEGHDHDHAGHDPSTCPFCKQGVDGKKNLALVKLLDGKGEVVGTSADKLLSLKEKQNVVVVGKPSLDPDGNLYIEATKIYVAK